jgi:rhodanese-related sulfurtransferase
MKFISPLELKKKIDQGENWLIVDIREPYELEISAIDCLKIPMAEIESNISKLPKNGLIAILCKSGNRSKSIVNLLECEHGYENVYSVEGGINGWAKEIDDSLEVY